MTKVTRRFIRQARQQHRVPETWDAHVLPSPLGVVQFQRQDGDYLMVRNAFVGGRATGIVTWPLAWVQTAKLARRAHRD